MQSLAAIVIRDEMQRVKREHTYALRGAQADALFKEQAARRREAA